MLIGAIRPVESRTVEAVGDSLLELQAAVEAQTPEGWAVTRMPAQMTKGTVTVRTVATIARMDGLRDIEADTMDALRARVPDGWQLLNVRAY